MIDHITHNWPLLFCKRSTISCKCTIIFCKRIIVLASLLVAGLAFPQSVNAQSVMSTACLDLQYSLSKLQRVQNPTDRVKKQIRDTGRQLRKYNCKQGAIITLGGGSFTVLGSKPKTDTVKPIQKRHNRIVAITKDEASSEADINRPTQQAIKDANLVYRMHRAKPETANSGSTPSFSKIMSPRYKVTSPGYKLSVSSRSSYPNSNMKYRAMCVRLCDGYYWPIAMANTREELKNDQLLCQAQCPNSDSALFYHRMNVEEPENMRSIRGVKYRSLQNAFLYREKKVPQCTCQSSSIVNSEGNSDITLRRNNISAATPVLQTGTDVEKSDGNMLQSLQQAIKQALKEGDAPKNLQVSKPKKKVRIVGQSNPFYQSAEE